jgi:hypothetical protein
MNEFMGYIMHLFSALRDVSVYVNIEKLDIQRIYTSIPG